MKIATYNIWDSCAGMPARFGQIVDEIAKVSSEVICLQEVNEHKTHDSIARLCGYDHSHWQGKTGLSIMCRVPIDRAIEMEYGTSVLLSVNGKTLLVVNVHLPWDKMSVRENAIVGIVNKASEIKADYTFLLGDFNSSDKSSIHRFLANEQSLLGADAYFFYLAEAFAEMKDTRTPATLNFRKNPRWGIVQPPKTIEVNQRFDWIMMKNPYPAGMPILKECTIFGMDISAETGLSPSDHYGVSVELEF